MLAGGCSMGGPKERLGSLPFPGALTLWDAADVHHLGTHVSETGGFDGLAESSRGTVYTCKAGFVDIAHVRESADWTRFAYEGILAALRRGEREARFSDHYQGEYRVAISIPAAWSRYTPEARRSEEERAARIAGQRVAYLAMTWHEAATWFGERVIPFISEDRSAFTYDDTTAHVIGVRLGGEAILLLERGEAASFDQAMTTVLDRELARIDGRTPEETYVAAIAVEGRWWRDENCIKRQLATGLDEAVLTPWIIDWPAADVTFCPGAAAEPQRLAWEDKATLRSLSAVLGPVQMRSEAYAESLGLEPGHATAGPPCGDGLVPAVDAEGWVECHDFMRRTLAVVRVTMRERLGDGFDRP